MVYPCSLFNASVERSDSVVAYDDRVSALHARCHVSKVGASQTTVRPVLALERGQINTRPVADGSPQVQVAAGITDGPDKH